MALLTHLGHVSLGEGHDRLGFPIALILRPLARLPGWAQLAINLQVNPILLALA